MEDPNKKTQERWEKSWQSIVSGGPQRWKQHEGSHESEAYDRIAADIKLTGDESVFVPLCGDSLFGVHAASKGHKVVFMDIAPTACDEMQKRVNTLDANMVDRCRVICGNVVEIHDDLKHTFDIVYDKDSFGAIPIEVRAPYIKMLREYLREGGHIYMEVQNMSDSYEMTKGPPFHIHRELIDEHFVVVRDYGLVRENKFSDASVKMSSHAYLLKLRPVVAEE